MSYYSPYKPGEWKPDPPPETTWTHTWKTTAEDEKELRNEVDNVFEFFGRSFRVHTVCAVADVGVLHFLFTILAPEFCGIGMFAFGHVDRKLLVEVLEGRAETHPRRWEITVRDEAYTSVIKVTFHRNADCGIVLIDADANE